MLNNAKNIEIGRIEITVQAIDFARSHAELPWLEVCPVGTVGHEIAFSTSE